MAEAKFKRGSASNLASLAKEDGSVIFAVKDASSPTTLVFDKAIGETVQRLGVAVSNAATSNYAVISSTANLAKDANALSGKVISNVATGTSATYANKIPFIKTDGVMEVSRYIDFHGDETSRDYSLRFNTGNASQLAITGPSASTVIADYFSGNAKNSNALEGSSLSQILTAAGGGNSFTALDTATNNTVKLTRANGGTVAKIINNVSNAGTASYSGKTKFIISSDTRTVNAPPSSYQGVLGSKEEFKQNSTIGTSYLGGTYSHLITHTPWTDSSGGLPYQIAYGANGIMRRVGSSAAAWGNWHIMLDTSNYTSYAADRTAFIRASVSGKNITFTRANGGTASIITQDSTYHVYGNTINAGFSTAFRTQAFGSSAQGYRLAAIRNNTAGVSNAPQHGSGVAWANADTHGYLYVSYPADSPQAFIGGGNGDRLNWIKELAFTDTKMATASTADYAKTLEGHPASYFAVATGTSSNVVENGMYLLSNTSQVNNRFSVKNGQLTSGNTNFPSNLLLAAASTDYPQLAGDSSGTTKNYSILHFGNSAYRHDIVMACSGTNTGIIYAFATTANTGGRLARIMDSLNYSGYMYRFDNQITFSKGLIANSPSSTVLIDGGSYTGGTQSGGSGGGTGTQSLSIRVEGSKLIITTK